MRLDEYQPDSFDGLLTALLQHGDKAARKAMGEYLQMRTSGETPVVERHPQYGWRVRPLNQPLE